MISPTEARDIELRELWDECSSLLDKYWQMRLDWYMPEAHPQVQKVVADFRRALRNYELVMDCRL